MKKYVILLMLILFVGVVSAAREPYYKVNTTKTPTPTNDVTDQLVTDKGIVITLQPTANPNITQKPGGEVFDLSTPQTTTPTENVTGTLPVAKVTHSFWYWLWPPHWFTK